MQSSQNASAGRDRAKPLVYLVDDEPMVLELTSQILQPLGYELRQFRSPVEALETFTNAERKPDLVITDYAMGPMNGIELMVAIRKVRPEQRIFLVSGTVGTEVCGEGPANPDAFMPKPFQVTEFSGVVYRLTH